MASISVPIQINLPDNWPDVIAERLKQDGDYVNVVRCGNCRYNDGTAYCELHFRDVDGTDFCSWGEVTE